MTCRLARTSNALTMAVTLSGLTRQLPNRRASSEESLQLRGEILRCVGRVAEHPAWSRSE
jgi:hypothetical protein